MEGKKEEEPDAGGKSTAAQALAAPPQQADVDDFGLPIRRYAATPTKNDAEKGNGDTKESNDGTKKADDPKGVIGQGQVTGEQSKPQQRSETEVSDIDPPKITADRTDRQVNGYTRPTEDANDAARNPTGIPESNVPPTPKAREPDDDSKTLAAATSDHTTENADQNTVKKPFQDEKPAQAADESQSGEPKDLPAPQAEPTSPSEPGRSHGHKKSKGSLGSIKGDGKVSGFSHQTLPTQPEPEKKDEDDEWQEMPAYARYDMYDDDDRLIAREHDEDDDEENFAYGGLGGAGKGYTRVQMDEDAQSANSMDDNTKYLFKEGAKGTAMVDEEEEDDARDAMSQMQATKDLLTEGQRIAYVGVVRLEIAKMVKEGQELESMRKIRKEVATSAESSKMWGQKMMIRLYAHMDISSAEQIMIEQLAEHGVQPQDLVPALHANARVKNPMAGHGSEEAAVSEAGGSEKPEVEKGADGSSTPLRDDEKPSKSPSTPGDEKFPKSPISLEDEEPAEPPPPYESHEGDELPDVQTPSQLPSTAKIDIDLRWTVLCDLFLILVADSIYDARSRVLLERVGKSLDISWIDICRFEKRVTDALEMQQAAEKENWNEDEHMESRRKRALKKRYMMLGLATVGGGLVIGLSAGLLAPVIGAGLAAGFSTIGVAGTSSFLGGVGGAAVITSGAAATGSIIGGRAANRRTGAVKTFEYRPLHNNKRVNLIVTVSGWLTGKVDDVRLPFSTVDSTMGDIYSVLFEPEMLRSTGDTVRILATEALTQSIQQILGSTILAALMGALQLPIVLTKLSYLIDNPWAVSLDRATAAGKILADSIIERNLGTRPITLVGYSLGSRVIFSCLQELAKRGGYGLVQNVYLFGSPVVVKKEEYIRARTVVPGRFVNGYSRTDWILGYLFRLTNGGIRRVAGLAAIEELPWIENVDVTNLVKGHMDYRTAMPKLLIECGWMVESEEFTEIEDPDPDNHDQRQRELINEIEEARKELEKEGKEGKSKFSLFGRRKKVEKQEWELYEDSNQDAAARREEDDKDRDAAYRGALFDVDAIRAELAKESEARKKKNKENGVEEEEEEEMQEMQIKEIKSTLPPMKLDIPPASATSSASTPIVAATRPYGGVGGGLKETRSADHVPMHYPAVEDEVQMTFDTAFGDDHHHHKTAAPGPGPQREDGQLSRPEIRSSQTLPNVSTSNPWGDPDDEDFGKEKEISMAFA